MKNVTLIYCGEDGDAARALSDELRDADNDVAMCSTEYFVGAEIEAARVIIMPDVPFFRAVPIKEAYPKAEYSPPDEFSIKDIKKALAIFDTPEAEASRQELISQFNAITPAEMAALSRPLDIAPPKKRGWPKGKSRKAVA